jgi:hypothetical protein
MARVGESPYLTSGQLTATNVARPGVTRRTNELMLKLREEKAQEDVIQRKNVDREIEVAEEEEKKRYMLLLNERVYVSIRSSELSAAFKISM